MATSGKSGKDENTTPENSGDDTPQDAPQAGDAGSDKAGGGSGRELVAPVTNFSLPGGVGSKNQAAMDEAASKSGGTSGPELKAPVTNFSLPGGVGTKNRGGAAGDHPADPEPAPEERQTAAPASSPRPDPAPETPARRPSVFPMVLGGVLAGAIGFGAAFVLLGMNDDGADQSFRSDTRTALDTQEQQLGSLGQRIDGLAAASDLEALRGTVEETATAVSDLSGRVEGVEGRIDELVARIDELEQRPISEGVSEEAIAAYERELQRLQDSVAQQRQEVESMATEAAEMEQNAQETARQTMARSAATRILTALEAGDPFPSALADLQETGADVPEVLRQVASDGVATRAALTEAFPDAARRALSAAREGTPQEGGFGDRVGTFLRDQLGARSVAPREGNDPDAVLSRAEAAVQEGRLTDALAEIDTLPEAAQAEMNDWVALASARRDALDAAESLAQSLNQ